MLTFQNGSRVKPGMTNRAPPRVSKGYMRASYFLVAALALLVSGCETVSTQVVQYDPAVQYPPTHSVEVLLQKPARPHTEIGLIEARGRSEAELLNTAREKARALGADAIVKVDVERVYHDPVPIYDPWFDPFYYGYYRHRPFPPFPYPWGPYRYVGGGFTYTLKAAAIRYTDKPS
jgi:hypothetical protein